MAENPAPIRRFQFSLWTLFVIVTVTGVIAGAIRWLVILTGGRVAVSVLVALSLAAIWVRVSFWGRRFWRKWERRREERVQHCETEATRKLLELPEVKEAILAVKSANPQNPGHTPATRP
ncbi:MAG TPA: hypothetical protein VGY55_16995 [Pirellulales bacterium]|nr:hypothetical protein [Pirellulales bacterium]